MIMLLQPRFDACPAAEGFGIDGTTFTMLATTNWSNHLYQPAVFATETERRF